MPVGAAAVQRSWARAKAIGVNSTERRKTTRCVKVAGHFPCNGVRQRWQGEATSLVTRSSSTGYGVLPGFAANLAATKGASAGSSRWGLPAAASSGGNRTRRR